MSRKDHGDARRPRGLAFKNLDGGPDARLAEIDKDQAKIIFAHRLQAAIDAKGWNQSDLARHASKFLPDGKEFGRDNISNYVAGRHLPSSRFLKAIANALDVKPVELLPKIGIPSAASLPPPMDVRDMGDGHAFLRINKRVPWSTALEILRLANDAG